MCLTLFMLGSTAAARRNRKPRRSLSWRRSAETTPAWVVLVIPIVALVVAIVSVTGLLAFYNGERAVSELLERYKQTITIHVEHELIHCLSIPYQINSTTAAAVSLGLLDFDDPVLLERYFWQQLKQFPAVNYIYAGSKLGGIVGVGRNGEGELRSYGTERFVSGEYRLYRASDDGVRQEQIDAESNYDGRSRPWYKASAQSGEEAWSNIYLYVGEPLLGIAASSPVVDQAGEPLGVVATDLVLTQIGKFLKSLDISPSSRLFIMERSGKLVATSADEPPFTTIGPSDVQLRRHASESGDRLTHAAYRHLVERFGDLADIRESRDTTLWLDGRNFVQVVPFSDGWGLDWLIVMVMPERDFMSQIHRNTRYTVVLCLVAVALAIGLSVRMSRWLSRPLKQLSEASQGLAEGKFSQQLSAYQTRELNMLSKSFNAMAQQLQDSFEQLAQRNKHLEKRVEERTAHLTQANYQLQLLLRSVSHDLRNPIMGMLMVLNNIQSQAETKNEASLADGLAPASRKLPPEIVLSRSVLDTLVSSGQRQLRLVNSLLDHHTDQGATAPSGPTALQVATLDREALALQPYSLRQIISQVVQDLQPLIVKQRAIVEVSWPETLPLVLADPDQLWRVVENLVGNAIAHNAPDTRVTITAEALTSSRIGTGVCCRIIDDGVGISLEQQPHLFAPYHQGDNHPFGLGLGLYVCRRIIAAHSGVIGISSQSGDGAVFWFTLPAAGDDSKGSSEALI